MSDRLARLRTRLQQQELDALLVSTPENRRYLSGFTGSAGYLVITQQDAVLATDFRYIEQAGQQAPAFRVHRISGDLAWLPKLLQELGVRRVGLESQNLTMAIYQQLTQAIQELPQEEQPTLTATADLVEELRAIKDPQELASLQRAIDLGDQAFAQVAPTIRPGMTEQQVAWELERIMRESGAESVSFELIVAAGPNAALPHHRPSDHVIQEGEPVVIDMGAQFDGYCSDLSRTICLGAADETFRRVYDTVLGAQLTAINTIQAGMSGADCDGLARTVIEEAGYGENFGHSLGHGVGLAVHEYPRVGPRATERLQDGMVFTIEPGIYLPGWGGVRIEDVVILENGRARILSHAPKPTDGTT